jgi:FKBP-type peptidyl-prolyl cis-trans isomerase FkpA
MMRRRFIAAISVVLFTVSCGEDSPFTPGEILAPLNIPFSNVDLTVGTGAEATSGRRVSMTYTGWIYDPNQPENKGFMFDSNTAANPFNFNLGNREVIAGWDQGIPGMRVGGSRLLVLPPALAYGAEGTQTIPGNATLIFEVTLLGVL